MLFSDKTNRYLLTDRVGDGDSENLLTQIDAFGMVTQGPVTIIGKATLTLVKPLVNGQVVIRIASMLSH